MNEKPTAVISGASLGALRSGRYATRSIRTLSEPHTSMQTIRVAISPNTSATTLDPRPSPTVAANPTAVNEPIIKTSPWAKLISSMIP